LKALPKNQNNNRSQSSPSGDFGKSSKKANLQS